tara:strand:- start:109 stop:1179 length:1071 start_codon:yes stop_codon:yes gene_type:complete
MKKKTIFIVDPVCPKFYDLETLEKDGMGASESYLLSNIIALAKDYNTNNYLFLFFQDTREEIKEYNFGTNTIKLLPLRDIIEYEDYNPRSIILQRDPRLLLTYFTKVYPKSNLILYCHDFYEGGNLQNLTNQEIIDILNTGVKFICVSKWHVNNIKENLKLRNIKIENIDYNYFYFDDSLKEEKRDPYKLCYFSGHHKGLSKALTIFKKLREIDSKFKLIIGSPSYSTFEIKNLENSGIELKYNLPREKVLEEMNTSLCLLHPNEEYPETFGCVNMEANMLGIPVLCYPYGATFEIITDHRQFIIPEVNLYDPEDLRLSISMILSWNRNPITIDKFNLGVNKTKVINKWIKILKLT